MSSQHQVDGHTLTLLRNGEEYFPRLIAAIEGASHTVYLETYIYATDESGNGVALALRRAAARGVRVHLLLDGFGCAELPLAWVEEMRRAGVEVLRFRPEISWLTFRRTRLRRLHRKLAVVDGRIAFVGGINIINDIPAGTDMSPRLDYAVEIHGEVVRHVNAVVRRLWVLVSWMSLRRRRRHVKLMHKYTHSAERKVAFLLRDNLRNRRSIEQAYLKAIEGSQHEIILASAYFIPGKRMRDALRNAVQRGVRVRLLLQGRVEYHLPHYAALALYDELLGSGVEIHEYHVSFLHAKAAVVDGRWTTVGSSNIDPFSLWLAREANLVVQDAAFAQALRSSLLHEMEHAARPVAHADWRKQGMWTHLLARVSYYFVQILAGVVGYAPWRDDA